MVPFPPAIVAFPSPLSKSLWDTNDPPRPKRRSLTPPTTRHLVTPSDRTVRLWIAYSFGDVEGVEDEEGAPLEVVTGVVGASLILSKMAMSSHAPHTVYTGTISLISPLRSLGNSDRIKSSPFCSCMRSGEGLSSFSRI